jgi:hypothetical protein
MMPSRHALQILVLAADPDLAELYRHECPQSVVMIAKDADAAVLGLNRNTLRKKIHERNIPLAKRG